VKTPDRRVVVFACGDPLRGDDSVAPQAVTALPAGLLTSVEVRVVGGLSPEQLIDLPDEAGIVIVDAVVGIEPGRVVSLSLAEMAAAAAAVVTTSSHQLPLDQVVALASLMRDEPLEGCFVGMGIEAVAPGAELSGPVAAALPALTEAVAAAVESLR
jgi:hydrogenase maturation protease